jgi:RNA polymerase-binding transcription factor DksA
VNVDVMDLLNDEQRAELGQIHLALERIERGIFGVCEKCSERIAEDRLLTAPWKPECAHCESVLVSAELIAPTDSNLVV